jgi:hypothetical protein
MPWQDEVLIPVLVLGPASAGYVNPLVDHAPLLSLDPALKLEPTPLGQWSEYTFFTRYVLLDYAKKPKSLFVAVSIGGTGHIYVDTAGVPHSYRLYAKLVRTSNFSTFTDVTTETTVMSYDRGAAATAAWYDEGAIGGALRASVDLAAGEALLLVLRGTAWGYASGVTATVSHGINSTNLKVGASLFTR